MPSNQERERERVMAIHIVPITYLLVSVFVYEFFPQDPESYLDHSKYFE
jgi:hypothetical protein